VKRCGARAVLIAFVTAAALTLGSPSVTGSTHPALARVDGSLCVNCHDDLLEGAVTHPPAAEDCTSCHDVVVGETETEVSLAAAEPDLCVLCHDDLSGAAGAELQASHPPVTDACTTCHDPHAAEYERLLVGTSAELCGTCHDTGDLAETHDGQVTGGTRCVSCHLPHGSDHPKMLRAGNLHRPFADGSCNGCHRQPFGDRLRLRARGERLCQACHGEFEPQEKEGVIHEALQGKGGRAGCLQCHDPHLSARGGLLAADGGELCGSCHPVIVDAATSASGHAAAADDCLTCHLPHVSDHPTLLTDSASSLCTMCHDPDDADLTGSHLGAAMDRLRCTGCHDPHGTGNESLLATNVHAPLSEGCDTCHEGSAGELMEDGESALCLICHEEVGLSAAEASAPHAAMEIGRCADCHNPHASAEDHLVALPGGGECLQCHDEQGPGENEVAHGIIPLAGCRACHEPHGGDREKLLRAPIEELCLGCHREGSVTAASDEEMALLLGRFEVPRRVALRTARMKLSDDGLEGHPVAGHRVRGTPTQRELRATDTTFSGELSCVTCHDPHKGPSALLLRWGAASSVEACAHCHSKK
jgi:predicted CXXCH cytochrome family protein